MCDSLEMYTTIRSQKVFYKITSNAFSFGIRGAGNAVVGLSKRPSRQPTYLIVLCVENRSWIQKNTARCKSKTEITPALMDTNEYRRFWLTWHGTHICFGRDGQFEPILRYACDIEDLSYVTFGSTNRHTPVQWKIELPPQLEETKFKAVTKGELKWKMVDAQLPNDAFIGGYENETLYIIRAPHRGSMTPGKYVPTHGLGYVSWGGAAIEKGDFEILCGYNYSWVPTTEDKIPVGAIEAGFSEALREPLYVGRACHEGHLIPGKVQPSHKCCYIPYDRQEVSCKKFEVLVSATSDTVNPSHPFLLNFDIEVDIDEDSDPEDDEEDYMVAF